VEKEISKEQKRKLMKKAAVLKKEAEFNGESIIDQLARDLDVSETMIAALLEVTERTLQNWKDQNYDELSGSGKSKRLIALFDFVHRASELKVPMSAMLNLLQEPIKPEDPESNTPLFFIVDDPDNKCFRGTQDLMIKNFLASMEE